MRRVVAVALLLGGILVAGRGVADEATARERALSLHDEARALYALGKYREAVEKLRLAVELDPEAKVLYYNLGLIEEKLGNIGAALAYFRHCLELETSDEEKRDIADTIKRLEGVKKSVTFGDRDSQPPIIIRRTDKHAEAEALPTLLFWSYVAGGTALAGGIVGTALAARAGDVDPGDAPTTSAGVTPDDLQDRADEAHALAIGADVAFAVGLTALGSSVVLVVLNANVHDHDEAEARAELRLGPLGGECVFHF